MNNYRTFHLTLNPSTFNNHKHVYTIVSISSTSGKVQKTKTTWNKPIKFKVNEAACVRNEVTLVVKFKGSRVSFDNKLGEVRVRVKELMEGVTSEGKTKQTVSYPVKGRSGESMGDITFCYEFGKLFSAKSDFGLWFKTVFLDWLLDICGDGCCGVDAL